jgi:hypothetical protein
MNLVATYNFGEVPYARHTVPYMQAYAARCGADFFEHRAFSQQHLYPPGAGWFKLEAIRQFARQDRHTTLLLLDADQLVMPSCPDLFAMTGDRIRAVVDMGIPEGGDFAVWCQNALHEPAVVGLYFNSGMLLIPLTAARRLAPFLSGPYTQHALFEQHFLNQRVRQRESIDWLPNDFNWLAPQFQEASLQKQVVHFVGSHKNLLDQFVPLLESLACPGSSESLSQLGQRMGTDKGTDHSYLEVYEQLFEPLRRRPMSMLEIGVYKGNSLRMWKSWFPMARIFGMDINPEVAPVPGCELVIASQTDRAAIESRWSDESLDLIIDDGSHRLEHQLLALCYLWPKLKRGGLYVIEDLSDIALAKHFAPFRPLVLDRRHRRSREDDNLLVLMK